MAPLQATFAVRWTSDDGAWWFEPTGEFVSQQTRLTTASRIARTRRAFLREGLRATGCCHSTRVGGAPRPIYVFSAASKNILDKNYRVHGSGPNEPGTNLVIGFTTTF
jgi:hypothetical protein